MRALVVAVLAAIAVFVALSWLVGRDPRSTHEVRSEPGPAPAGQSDENATHVEITDPPQVEAGGSAREAVDLANEHDSGMLAFLEVGVVSSVHGGRLANVEVHVIERGEFEPASPRRRRAHATCDAGGQVRFELGASVPWTIYVDQDAEHGWAELDVEPLAPGGERTVLLAVPTAGDVTWFGRVTRQGEPFANARVRLFDLTDDDAPRFLEETESDSTGLVRFVGTSWVALEVRVSATGIGRTVVDITPGHETPVTAQELPLWPVASLRCLVVDPNDAPVPGIEVRALVRAWELRPPDAADAYTRDIDERSVTDEAGVALLTDVPAELNVALQLHRGDEVLLKEDRAVVLAAGVETERRFVIGDRGRIEGRVEAVDGTPLADAQVDLVQNVHATYAAQIHNAYMQGTAKRSMTADASGRFVFEGVPYGAWYVGTLGTEEGSEHYSLAPRVELSSQHPNAEVTLRLERGLTIAGRVVDESGEGVSRAPVHGWNDLHGSIGRLETADDGAFEFEPMPAGTYNVWAPGAEGYIRLPRVQVPAGTQDLVFVLRRGLTLRGTVVDAISGQPVPIAFVTAFAPEGAQPYASHGHTQARSGKFEFKALPAGEIALRATTEDGGIGVLRGTQVQIGDEAQEVAVRLHEGIPVRVRYDGEENRDLAILALQDGIAVTYIATEPGATTTFHAMPGALLVRLVGEGIALEDQELIVAPGERPEVILSGEE